MGGWDWWKANQWIIVGFMGAYDNTYLFVRSPGESFRICDEGRITRRELSGALTNLRFGQRIELNPHIIERIGRRIRNNFR